MKTFWTLLGGILLQHTLHAQQNVVPGLTPYRNSITDPTVTSFKKVEFAEMNPFTGTPNIKIPLYELKLKSFTLPIMLSYDVNEVKPNTITSSTGLGWKLVAGGTISRSLNDRPDDVIARSPGGGRGFLFGYKYGYIYGGRQQADYIKGRLDNRANIPGTILEANLANYAQDLFMNVKEGVGVQPNCAPLIYPSMSKGWYRGHDTGPDIFNMNIGDRGAQFLLNDYQTASIDFLKYENMIGSYTIDNSFNDNPGYSSYDYMKGINQFTITDEKGNRFIFGAKDKIKVYGRARDVPYFKPNGIAANDYYGSIGLIAEYYSDWHLTTIITVDNERVDFQYTTEDVVVYQRSYNSRELDNSINYTTTTFNVGNGVYDISNDRLTLTRVAKTQNRLTKIISGYTTIDLQKDLQRSDLMNSYYLSQLTVTNNGHVDKSYAFTYRGGLDGNSNFSYTPGGTGNDPDNVLWMMRNSYFPNDRLPLPELYPLLIRIDESITSESHLFNYNIPGQDGSFPEIPLSGPLYHTGFTKNTFDVDFWGYFNGSPVDAGDPVNKSPYPTVYVHPNQTGANRFTIFPLSNAGPEYVISGANRNCNPASITIGTLKDIIYPTGGRQSFEFEANQFIYDGVTRYGGGMRLKKISLRDRTAGHMYVRKYEYFEQDDPDKTTGHLFNMPIFAYDENMPLMRSRYTNTIIDVASLYANDPASYYRSATWLCENPYYSNGFFEMTTVGYHHVREILLESGDMGYIDYGFAVPASIDNPQNDDVGLMTHPGVIPVNKSIYYKIFFMNDCDNTSQSLSIEPTTGSARLNYFDAEPCAYGAGPSVNYDWNRGQLLYKITTAQGDVPVEKEEWEYGLFQKGGNAFIYPGINISMRQNIGLYEGGSIEGYFPFTTCSPYYFITNVARVITKHRKSIYPLSIKLNINPDPVITRMEYTYDDHAQITKAATYNSKGEVQTDFIRYPYSFTTPAGNTDAAVTGINNMVAKNVITHPVETYTVMQKTNGSQQVVDGAVQFYNPQKPVPDALKELINKPLASYEAATVALENGQYRFLYDQGFKKHHFYDRYDANNNLQHAYDANENGTVNFWGYQSKYQVCQATNTAFDETGYEGFESEIGNGNFTITNKGSASPIAYDPETITGTYSLYMDYVTDIVKSIPNSQKHYILSCWIKNGQLTLSNTNVLRHTTGRTRNGYTYHEYEINGGSNLRITGYGYVDELRFHPAQAHMITYSYEPNYGITSQCDKNNMVTYYRYDGAGRLMAILDEEGNVLKQTEYYNYTQPR